MPSTVQYEKDHQGHVATITLARPEKLNALTLEMYQQIGAAVRDADADDSIKVIRIRGAGESFSTGQDLSEVGFMYGFDDGKSGRRRPSQRRRLVTDRDWSLQLASVCYSTKITVAEVQGHCLGSAFDIFLACDLSVVSEDAKLGHPGRRLVGPGTGFNTMQWIWKLGPTLAKYMMITGDTITGKQALEYRLTMHCVPAAELEVTTSALVDRVARVPADGIAMGKAAFRMAANISGVGLGYDFGYLMHSYGTNATFEQDEHNFFKERRDKGVSQAFHERDAHFELADQPG